MNYLLLILLFISTFIGTYLVRMVATKFRILDIPNDRSSHVLPTPRGGGVAIVIVWYSVIFLLMSLNKLPQGFSLALLCSFPISVISLIDDIFSINPSLRFLVQVLSSILALFFLGGFDSVDLGFVVFKSEYLNFVAILGLVWFTNLFNFLDGIDGYISFEVIFICVSSALLFGIYFPIYLAVIVLGFIFWNWQPARIFMGDVSSTILGFSIGVFAIYYQNINISSIISWLILTSLFWFDASLTLYRRWLNNEQLSSPHRKHGYQRIVQSGFSHQRTVLYSGIVNLVLFCLAYCSIAFPELLAIFLIVCLLFLYFVMKQIDKRLPFEISNT